MRLTAVFLILALLVLIPFLIWGDYFETMFSWDGSLEWMEGFGPWAWLAGIILLVMDLVLPLPNTLIISVLGFLYGPLLGGVFGALGTILSGLLAYGLCRRFGRGFALRLEGEKDLEKGERLFQRSGGWIIALSRWLPIIPEVVSCAAGLHKMPFRTFFIALCCGSIPLGFSYAALGKVGQEEPLLALALSLSIPPILWLLIHPWMRRRMQ